MKNYYLTIDVGIKNLAVCICSYSSNDSKSNSKEHNILKKINIVNWSILDVSHKPLYCKNIKNKRAICNCISKYYSLKNDQNQNQNEKSHSDPDNLIGYCKNHAKIVREYNKKNKKNPIKLFGINSNPIYKNNFSTQMNKLLTELDNYFNNVILKPYHYSSANLMPFNIDNLHIFIENQPVLTNPIMKSISVGIYTFFCIKKIDYPQIISSINFINPTVKTNQDFIMKLNNLLQIKSNITDFKSYTNRKNFSEDIVNKILFKLNYNYEFLTNSIYTSNYIIAKKKDDMADTLLYQLYVIIYDKSKIDN